MSRLELGLGFQGDKRPEAYAELARLGENLGFDVLTVYGDLLFQPALYPLLIMALNTRSVRLGPACLNPFTLHPMEIAGQAAALDSASQGRAFLGLARGAWLDRIGITPRRPVTALHDALEIVDRLLQGDVAGYTGKVFSLEPGTRFAYPLPESRMSVMIGTWSRRTARLAAQFGDEVKVGGSANPAMARQMMACLEDDLPRFGRAAGDVGVVMGAVTVIDRDGEKARRLARQEVAMYLDVVLELDSTIEPLDGLIDSIRQHLYTGDAEGAGRQIPDDILDLFAFAGTPEQICRQVEDLARAGVRRIEFGTPHGAPEMEGIRLLGERVLPNFR